MIVCLTKKSWMVVSKTKMNKTIKINDFQLAVQKLLVNRKK